MTNNLKTAKNSQPCSQIKKAILTENTKYALNTVNGVEKINTNNAPTHLITLKNEEKFRKVETAIKLL